ncbi:mRNA 3'-end-processing protein rna14 [Agyrium rufum]|nr:mRNA 3'-end-processing protein rna14 [Agyrium rufum]
MADAEAEAAFFESMNETNGDYEAADGDSELQIDSSSDEYDPAQEYAEPNDLSNTFSPTDASNSHVQSSSVPFAQANLTADTADALQEENTIPDQAELPQRELSDPMASNESFPLTTEDPDPTEELDATKVDDEAAAELDDSLGEIDSKGEEPVSQDILDTPPKPVTSKPPNSLAAIQTNGTRTVRKDSLTTPSSAVPKARLPHDKIGLLEDRIKDDPRGDMDAWLSLITEHRKRGKLEEARKVYERFFGVFPWAAEQWIAYAQMENDAGNRNAVEVIFNNTLMHIPHVQLWSTYLDHIRRHHNVMTDSSGQARQIITQAYDFALKVIGIDKESGRIWQDYIEFIRSGPGVIGGSAWKDQQKMDDLRKTYKAAICVPTQSVESLWREYNAFEMGLNKTLGRKFLQEQSPSYMTARASYTELQNITRDLRRVTLPVLPPALGFDGEAEYMQQVEIWRRWILWEKEDPLVLKEENPQEYKSRIVFAYKQALMALRFRPEMWFDAAQFCFENSLDDEGNDFLKQGHIANPESCLLAFKLGERIELTTTNNETTESIQRRGEEVRKPYDKLIDALYEMISKAAAREGRELARIEAQTANANGNAVDGEEDEDSEREKQATERKERLVEGIKNMTMMQIRLHQKTLSHAWIALIRAFRRVQGKGKIGAPVGGSRQLLFDAKKRGHILSDVIVAAAWIEYHTGEHEAARRLFERGAKLYPEDEVFALAYVKHLVSINDLTNARVVFETTVGRFTSKPETKAKAKSLYAYFHTFESQISDLSQIIKLEKRIKDTFPEDPQLSSFQARFAHEAFDPTAVRPMISPATQMRPKMMQSVEEPALPSIQNSPVPPPFVQPVASPKRALPVEDYESEMNRPRKLARGESPLKGAAGRRMDQQRRNQQASLPEGLKNLPPPPPPLPRDIVFLLSIIPKASTYHVTRLKPEAMVRLLRDTHIPSSVHQLPITPQQVQQPYYQPATPVPYQGGYSYHR